MDQLLTVKLELEELQTLLEEEIRKNEKPPLLKRARAFFS